MVDKTADKSTINRFTVDNVSANIVSERSDYVKEINLSERLAEKRREKGITQDELAEFIGVSKASVSKWETGNSFPDITHLPILASYFNISIDELISYSPQLSAAEISKIYTRLSADFASKPFDEVIAEIEVLVKKYCSCYPFLLQMVLLHVNHASLAENDERKTEILRAAQALCERITINSTATNTAREAAVLRALCHIMLGEPEKVLEQLGEEADSPPIYSGLIIQAHQMLGNTEKAITVMQGELYTSMLLTLEGLLEYMQLNLTDFETAVVAYHRAESLIELFNIRKLVPNSVARFYILAAHLHQTAGKTSDTIKILEKYVDVCTNGFFPVQQTGDDFFSKLDNWLEKENKDIPLPRSESVIKESMLNDGLLTPIFDSIKETPEFIALVNKLKNFIGGTI